MISPTGQGIRSDGAGDGHFHARRGPRRHRGVDFLCVPGQDIYMPIDSGMITRKRYPYTDTFFYEGVHIEGFEKGFAIEVCIFYVVLSVDYNLFFRKGEVIAYAQDVVPRYGIPMQPHVHLQIDRIDPLMFLEKGGPQRLTT